jgi:hypothetical protein
MAAGASNLFFGRNTKVYLQQGTTIWELPVLNGYSFSQSTNSSQITLNEMSDLTGRSRRGQRAFNDSLAPAEWSFDIYARPTVNTVVRAPEEALWSSLFGGSRYNPTSAAAGGVIPTAGSIPSAGTVQLTVPAASHGGNNFEVGDLITVSGVTSTGGGSPSGTFTVTAATTTTVSYVPATAPTGTITLSTPKIVSTTVTSTATETDFKPDSSNRSSLATFDLYFVLGGNVYGSANYANDENTTIYKVEGCVVNEATMNFEVDGIATISWSGMGTTISELSAYNASTAITTGLSATNNMIRNRLTAANIVGVTPNAKTYSITLTGGSITISNNMTFLTPETLGVVNTAIGHVTGTRSVSGSFTCYADELTNGSIDLYQDLLGATTTVTNKFQVQLFVGGKNAAGTHPVAPGIMFDMGQCHLDVPTINNDDVIAFEVNFTALPTSISGTDELTKIRYVGV